MLKINLFFILFFFLLTNIAFAQGNTNISGLEIPNVFTPNNDKKNDVFQIRTTNTTSLKVEIFNRWGNKIAEMNGINDCWDGRTSSGEELPTGNYFFQLISKDSDDNQYIKTGEIMLIR